MTNCAFITNPNENWDYRPGVKKVLAMWVYFHASDLSRQAIQREADSYLQSERLSMQGYFAKYGKVVQTFITNPHLVNWFDNWTERDQSLDNQPGYDSVNQDFVRISGNDDNILSAFFASATTGEYFKENERTTHYNGQPYYAYKRGWWQDALKINKLYVGPISVDCFSWLGTMLTQSVHR